MVLAKSGMKYFSADIVEANREKYKVANKPSKTILTVHLKAQRACRLGKWSHCRPVKQLPRFRRKADACSEARISAAGCNIKLAT